MRIKTGQTAPTTGDYEFDGYVDYPYHALSPTEDERVIPLEKGETAPPVGSSDRACWRRLIE